MASGDLKPKAIRTGRGHVRIRSGRSEGSRSETLYLPSAKGWGVLVTRLEQKAPGRVEQVNAAYTSQRCHACGYTAAESRESQARFGCRSCGHTAHADLNAARNIAAGHAGTARGGSALAGPVNREPQPASLRVASLESPSFQGGEDVNCQTWPPGSPPTGWPPPPTPKECSCPTYPRSCSSACTTLAGPRWPPPCWITPPAGGCTSAPPARPRLTR